MRRIRRTVGILLTMILMIMVLAGCGDTGNQAGSSTNPPKQDSAKADSGQAGSDDQDAQAQDTPAAPQQMQKITIGVIDGSLAGSIVWCAQQEGIFEKYGIEVEAQTFTNGMVMLEAIDNIDVALTGIGGILAGTINYDTQIISVIAPDSGTQYLFVRPDGAIAAAGQGHNTLNPEIYGDAESWKGAQVLSTSGNVLQYLLMNVLDGFGLTLDDVQVTWMDMPTCNASFLAGEGDAATVTGSVSYAEDKADYVVAATGPMCDLGLTTCMLADPAKIEAKETHDAMVTFLKACFESVEWMRDNANAAQAHMIDWCEYCGQECTPQLAKLYLAADPNYTLEEVYTMMHETSSEGDYSVVEERLLKILDFYVQCENYVESDKDKFLDHKFTTSIIDEVYESK